MVSGRPQRLLMRLRDAIGVTLPDSKIHSLNSVTISVALAECVVLALEEALCLLTIHSRTHL